MKAEQRSELIKRASAARSSAYAPYSKYRVGAALLAKSGRIFTGCNVENSSFGLCLCAERTAIVKAVSDGETSFEAMVTATKGGGTPCGACRQFLTEFCDADMIIIVHDLSQNGATVAYQLGELLPHAFRLS